MAFRTGLRSIDGDNHLTTILTIICRDTMSPPQLAGDAPIADIFHPVQVDFREVLGNNLNLPVFYNFNSRFGQRLHFYKPLQACQRFDNGRAALTMPTAWL